jgi:hypothetical protein
VVADEMNRHPLVARTGAHRAVVRDPSVPFGRRRTGVLVDIDVPPDDIPSTVSIKTWARELLKGLRTVAVVVPVTMLRDYDETLQERERRTIDLRSPGNVSRFSAPTRRGAEFIRFGMRWSRAGGT